MKGFSPNLIALKVDVCHRTPNLTALKVDACHRTPNLTALKVDACHRTPNLTALKVDACHRTPNLTALKVDACHRTPNLTALKVDACHRTPNLTALKVDVCHRTGKYTVCRRVRACFSSEILQAVLKEEELNDFPSKGERGSSGASRTILDLNVLKATLGKASPPPHPPRDGVERIWAFPSAKIPS